MTRRLVWGTLLTVALLLLGGLWLADRLERVPVDQWTPPTREARRNPYLALERFLAAMGRPPAHGNSAAGLDHLPPGGTLLLDSHRRAQLSPARRQNLVDWVSRGGYLIVAAEAPGIDDPLLEFFGVNCGCQPDETDAEPTAAKPEKTRPPERIAVAVPGADRPLHIDFTPGRLQPGERAPQWQAGAANRPAQIVQFRHGDGQVTMLSSLGQLFDNRHIGHRDHAELLWTLLETYQPDRTRPLTLVTQLAGVTLWQWLTETASTALLAGAVLLILGLWAVVPRFGPTIPPAPPARRRLGEHLAAVGRYVWRSGGLDDWLETARDSCRSSLARRHPDLLALPPAQQARALAELTGRPADLIAAALHQPVHSPQSFTLALRTLRNLERIL